jgi:hypothetical protein
MGEEADGAARAEEERLVGLTPGDEPGRSEGQRPLTAGDPVLPSAAVAATKSTDSRLLNTVKDSPRRPRAMPSTSNLRPVG